MPSLPDIMMYVRANVNSAKQGLQQVRDETDRLSESMGTLKQAGAMAAGMLLRDMVNSATAVIREFAELGGQIDTLQTSFNRLLISSGSTELSLESLRKATQKMIADVDLLQAANQAMMFNLPVDELDKLYDAVIRVGAATGRDATQSINEFTYALGRQSPKVLDNFAITLQLEEAYREYAPRIGKVTSELTENEKRTAFATIAMERMMDRSIILGDNISDTAKRQAQWNASIENFKTAIGRALGPLGIYIGQIVSVLSPAITVLTASYGKLFIAKLADVGATVKQKLADFAAAAAAVAHKVATWALNAALSVKIGLLTLGVGLIAAAAATTLYLAQMTREAAKAEEEFGVEILETNDILLEQKERLDDVSASTQKFLDLVGDLEHDFNLMQAEAAKSLWIAANMFDEAFSEGQFTKAAQTIKWFAKQYDLSFPEAERIIRDFIEEQKKIPDAIDESLVDRAQSAIEEFKECSRDKMHDLQDAFEDVKERLREKWQIGTAYGGTPMEAYRGYKAELAKITESYEATKGVITSTRGPQGMITLSQGTPTSTELTVNFNMTGAIDKHTADYAVEKIRKLLKNAVVEGTSSQATTSRIRLPN